VNHFISINSTTSKSQPIKKQQSGAELERTEQQRRREILEVSIHPENSQGKTN